jgi:hypothetical protein
VRTATLLVFFVTVARAQDPLLWGELEPGPYAVGFRSSIVLDGSRKYGTGNARPILFDVWYPAVGTRDGGVDYATYLRVPEVSAYPKFKGLLETFVRDVVCSDLFPEKTKTTLNLPLRPPSDRLSDLYPKKTEAMLNASERAAFERLLTARTAAHLNAVAEKGRYPVVLYHSGAGGSFEENSVLFEYLTSHGYVVVTSAFQSPLPEFPGNNIGGIERSGPDLNFIAHQTRLLPYADPERLATVGHSAGAQNILQWIGLPDCPVRTVVSLDTTLEYDQFLRLHKSTRAALAKLTPPRIPILLFAQARLKPRFTAFDRYLRRAPHYEAEAELDHDDFLTHGYLGRSLMQLPDAEAVRRSYEEVCRTIRKFLDASLRQHPSRELPLESSVPSSLVSIRYKAPR